MEIFEAAVRFWCGTPTPMTVLLLNGDEDGATDAGPAAPRP
jgi:hypothetical protein